MVHETDLIASRRPIVDIPSVQLLLVLSLLRVLPPFTTLCDGIWTLKSFDHLMDSTIGGSPTPMSQNSTQDPPLPCMGPEALGLPPLDENGVSRVMEDTMYCVDDSKGNKRISPAPSRGTETIPKGVQLEESENELFNATGVVAVMRGEAIIVIDSKPPAAPAPPQNLTTNDDATTTLPAEQLTSTHLSSTTSDASLSSSTVIYHPSPSDCTAPPFLPHLQHFKKLLPVCISVVSIARRYTPEQLVTLAKTQALVILLSFIFQPAHVCNSFLYFRSAFTKKNKHLGRERIFKAASETWGSYPLEEQGVWEAACTKLSDEKVKVYGPEHQYSPGHITDAVRVALASIGTIIEQGVQEGLSHDFIRDLQVVQDVARRKLTKGDKSKVAEKKRHEKNGKPPKARKAKKGKEAAQKHGAEQASAIEQSTVGQLATNAGTKRKRGANPPTNGRKTAKTQEVTQASRASASTSTAPGPWSQFCANSSYKRFGTGIPQAASTSVSLPYPPVGSAPTPTNPGSSSPNFVHAPVPIHGFPGFAYAGQTIQGNRLTQNIRYGDGSVSSNTPLSSIATPYSEFILTPDLPASPPLVRVACNPLDHHKSAPIHACGEKGTSAGNLSVPASDWLLDPVPSADFNSTSQQPMPDKTDGEDDTRVLSTDAVLVQNPFVDYNTYYTPGDFILDEPNSPNVSGPFSEWNPDIPHGEVTQGLSQHHTANGGLYGTGGYTQPWGQGNAYAQGGQLYGLYPSVQDDSYDTFNDYAKGDYNPAQFGFN